MNDRDRYARIRARRSSTSWTTTAAVVASALLGLLGLERAVHACSMAGPGIRARSVWPRGDRLPTNVRLVVHYDASGDGFPALGQDLVILDGTIVVAATADVAGTDVVLRPLAPLLPDHTYQIGDRRTVPCQSPPVGGADCGLTEAVLPFATFFTGSGEDVSAPTFAGLTSIAVGEHRACDNGACCGPYDLYYVNATWAAGMDGPDDAPVRYRIYQREGAALKLIADNVDDTQITGVALCSGNWGGPRFGPGRYLVRAFDGAGNEDSNTVERRLGDPCAGGCAVAGAPPSPDGATVATALLLALSALALATRQRQRASTRARNR